MKLVIYFILLVVVFVVCDPFPALLNANGTVDSYTAKTIVGTLRTNHEHLPNLVSFRNEFIAFFGPSNSVGILKRNTTGGYDLVSTWIVPGATSVFRLRAQLDANSDGWVSLTIYVTSTNLYLLKVADNGTITEVQTPTIPSDVIFEASQFHQDGYLIGVGRYWASNPTKPASLHRFQLVNGNWTLTDTVKLAEKLYTSTEIMYYSAAQTLKYSKAAFQLVGNFFVAADPTTAYIYELSTNQTSWKWSVKESIGLFLSASYAVDSLAWNGNDAIMGGYAFADTMAMRIKSSSNGTWTSQGRTGGIDGSNYLGYTSLSLNEDTFLVSSIFTNQQVAIVQRHNGVWWLTGVIVPSNSTSQTFFGATLAVTDQHLLIDGQNDLHAVPLCVFDPIDYDCPSVVELESCDFGEFKAEVACTSKATPECSFPVTTTVTDQFFANNTIYISFEMQRFGAVPRQATVGLRCGLSSVPSTGPSTGPSSPSNTPSVNNSPITMNSPASAPRNSDSATSGSENNHSSYVFVLLTFVLFLSV